MANLPPEESMNVACVQAFGKLPNGEAAMLLAISSAAMTTEQLDQLDAILRAEGESAEAQMLRLNTLRVKLAGLDQLTGSFASPPSPTMFRF
jgi:hypothetical protein